ncbi:BRO family protein [Solitalea koreensis]|nr:BRO family protein [Solitalea koreensis]
MSDIILNDHVSFEDFKNQNGITYWWASDLMTMLGYKDMVSFNKPIERALKACLTLNIPHYENFIAQQHEVNGEQINDYKLTRFACYLTVMNADPKKEAVAAAQVYFAEQTRKFEVYIQSTDQIERLLIRDEIKEGNKSLMSAANAAGVQDFAKFNNAGYMGLYNMHNYKLAQKRNVETKDLMEHMGRTELAANLFRITQTEERIKNFNISGQVNLEQTHYNVGSEVRKIVIQNTGKSPESLPVERKLPEVQKELKKGAKLMAKEDKPAKERKG